MLTDLHKKLIQSLHSKLLIHRDTPIYIDRFEEPSVFSKGSNLQTVADRWTLPADCFAYVCGQSCSVINRLNDDEFKYIMLLRHRYQQNPKKLVKCFGKVSLTRDQDSLFNYTQMTARSGRVWKNSYNAYTDFTSIEYGAEWGVQATFVSMFSYFGMTIIDHEYVDVEDQAEIHYTPSSKKPPVKVRYIKRVLPRYVNGPKTKRGPVTTGYEVAPGTRTYKHPRYKNVRGMTLPRKGYRVGPKTDNRPIEYRRKEQ